MSCSQHSFIDSVFYFFKVIFYLFSGSFYDVVYTHILAILKEIKEKKERGAPSFS